MSLLNNKAIKYKLLTPDELVINLDRLSRFKLPELTLYRVFTDIMVKYLISPKYSKEEILKLDSKYVVSVVSEIWNKSVEKHCTCSMNNDIAYETLKFIIKKSFCNTDEYIKALFNAKLNIQPVFDFISYDSAAFNIKFLIKVSENIKNAEDITEENLNRLRENILLCILLKSY